MRLLMIHESALRVFARPFLPDPNAITRMKLLFSLFFSLVITSSAISIQQSDDLQSWNTIEFTVLNEQQEVEKLIVTVELPKESKGSVQLQVSAEITP